MIKFIDRSYLWPTHVAFYETEDDFAKTLYNEIINEYSPKTDNTTMDAKERRVRDILDTSKTGNKIRDQIYACAKNFLGRDWESLLDTTYCENRALIIEKGAFINTHADNREGDITCVYFLTGNENDEPINSVGNPRFVLEDPSRYADQARLPFESRPAYSVNPRPGMIVVFPSWIPHNMHPYTGDSVHMQIVANLRINMPVELQERLFD